MGDTVKGSGAPGFSFPGGFCVFQDGIQVQSAQIQVVIERKLRCVGREGATGCQDTEMDQTGDEEPPPNTPQEELPHSSNPIKELLWCLAQHPDT